MKNKKLLVFSIVPIAILTVLIVIFFTSSQKEKLPTKPKKKTAKTVTSIPKKKFAYDTVFAVFDGNQFILSLNDEKKQCSGKDLYLQLRKTEKLKLLNNIYTNDDSDFILSPEKSLMISNVLFKNISFTEKEEEILSTTEFSKIPIQILDKLVKFTYYAARINQPRQAVKQILKSHSTTQSIMLKFRRSVKAINHLDFLPENFVKFNGTLLFEKKIVSRKINKDEVTDLIKAKVNLGTIKEPKYGIKLNNIKNNNSEITVFSCQDLINAFSQNFHATTESAKSAQRTFYTVFNVLSAATHHKTPQKDLFKNNGLNSLDKLPVTMLPAIVKAEIQELRKHGGTIADLKKSSNAIKIVKAEKEYLHLFYNHGIVFRDDKESKAEDGMELVLSEVMRGDFNSDGFNSIFLQAKMRAPGNEHEFFAFMLISMKEENSNFIQMNIPWK